MVELEVRLLLLKYLIVSYIAQWDIIYFIDWELIHKSKEFTGIFGNTTSRNSQGQSGMNNFIFSLRY